MDLTLTEVLDVLLRAEDESGKQRDSAKREAEEVMRRAQERFACDREARLKAAHSDALAQIESTRKSVAFSCPVQAQFASFSVANKRPQKRIHRTV